MTVADDVIMTTVPQLPKDFVESYREHDVPWGTSRLRHL